MPPMPPTPPTPTPPPSTSLLFRPVKNCFVFHALNEPICSPADVFTAIHVYLAGIISNPISLLFWKEQVEPVDDLIAVRREECKSIVGDGEVIIPGYLLQ